jgi:hypothetical protein
MSSLRIGPIVIFHSSWSNDGFACGSHSDLFSIRKNTDRRNLGTTSKVVFAYWTSCYLSSSWSNDGLACSLFSMRKDKACRVRMNLGTTNKVFSAYWTSCYFSSSWSNEGFALGSHFDIFLMRKHKENKEEVNANGTKNEICPSKYYSYCL